MMRWELVAFPLSILRRQPASKQGAEGKLCVGDTDGAGKSAPPADVAIYFLLL
jgi:hypothetical protein